MQLIEKHNVCSPHNVVLELNLNDWSTLGRCGSKTNLNTREFINKQIAHFAEVFEPMECAGVKRKIRNYYHIPEEHKELFQLLACHHSTNVSAIVFRYVILPVLISCPLVIADEEDIYIPRSYIRQDGNLPPGP